jgi:hypothetical protein
MADPQPFQEITMSTQALKDASHRIIGYTETRSDGVQVIKSPNYRILGYYNPLFDQTRNANYQIIGHDNLLTTLLASA